MSKKYFWGKKSVLKSGREVDLSCDEEKKGIISVLAMFNQLDAVHEITKPVSIRCEWSEADSDAVVSLECRGGSPREGRPVSESELPIEGLNGFQEVLSLSELHEILALMQHIHQKVRTESAS